MAKNKSRNLLDKVMTLEKEIEYLGRRLNVENEDAENARTEAQAARKRVVDLELELKNMRGHHEKTESATCAGVDRAHTLFVVACRDLGAQTTPFNKLGEEVGTHLLGWLQDELESLPSIVMGLMSYASLVTCKGVVNALSREGCRHFEAFERGNEDFDAGVFQIEDDMLKRSSGALYNRMWGPHGRGVVRERADRALAHVCFGFDEGGVCIRCLKRYCAVFAGDEGRRGGGPRRPQELGGPEGCCGGGGSGGAILASRRRR
jgi:hypothetical protein